MIITTLKQWRSKTTRETDRICQQRQDERARLSERVATYRSALKQIRALGTWRPEAGDGDGKIIWQGEERMTASAQIAHNALSTEEGGDDA